MRGLLVVLLLSLATISAVTSTVTTYMTVGKGNSCIATSSEDDDGDDLKAVLRNASHRPTKRYLPR